MSTISITMTGDKTSKSKKSKRDSNGRCPDDYLPITRSEIDDIMAINRDIKRWERLADDNKLMLDETIARLDQL